MLQRAKIGDIQGLAYAAIFEGGWTDHGWSGCDEMDIYKRMLAEVTILMARFEYELVDGYEEE